VYGDRVPQIKELAAKAGVESGVIIGGGALVATLITLALFGATILTLAITVLYPAVKSIQALESETRDDDKEWLTYWIIFGLFTLIDDCCGCILSCIPYYFWIKLAFFVFLFAPQTRGAQLLYRSVVKDLLDKYKDKIEGLISDVKGSVKEGMSEAKKTAIKELSDPSRLVQAAQVTSQLQNELRKNE
jgi:receptor expression-enhancing protein 5/6